MLWLFVAQGWLEADAEAAIAPRIPLGRFGTPLDMGAAVLFLCSPVASWISG